ncbi:hypothetical protein [Paenibacillus graminis]|uniref:DUF2334 domain-containing protein n=1 Tax=Paenibacillus graminis TaxID=189425 RepID=A0A089ME27_9BACL|nr:hypothetical protein [Paenibacillus graminis]AIQ71547.1 hypothetical protein PGRAT_31170 [Paenibacillus graminis]
MNQRRATSLLLPLIITVLVLLSAAPPVQAQAGQDASAPQRVLLLYDSLAKGTVREGNVSELQRLLSAMGSQVTLLSLDHYEPGTMDSFARVITVMNAADLAPANRSYLEDTERYTGQALYVGYHPPARLLKDMQLTTGTADEDLADLTVGEFTASNLQVRDMAYIAAVKAERTYGSFTLKSSGRKLPFAASAGSYTYVPYLERDNASVVGMSYVLREWLGGKTVPQTFLVLKEIYPFSDLDLLEETADRLYKAGIPFIASVRPVFSNTGFPAMQRYLDALKVVQSRNGSILVNAPEVMPSINSNDHTLGQKMGGFVNLLVKNGIAPLGIGANLYWSYDREYAEAGMDFFDSAVLFPDKTVLHMEPSNVSKAFPSSLYSLTPEFLQELHYSSHAMPQLPLNTAITAELPEDEAGLDALLETLERQWVSFADYKQGLHKTVTDENTVVSEDGVVLVNGAPLNVGYAPEAVSSDYQYKEEQVRSFTKLFSVQSKFFIIVIIVALLLFGALMTVGYRLYRKKYLKS